MPVPFVDLQRFESGFLDAWAERCLDVGASARFVGAAEVAALEDRLAAAAGLPHAVACANGTDALQLVLRALGVGRGDIVLVPDLTFWATFEAVVNVGAAPVTVDASADDLQMDFELFEEALERHRPSAAILAHLYGWGSERLEAFRRLCADAGLPLIEDGAQCWGATWRGAPIYEGAQIATVSFYPTKVLGACGDAGAVLCADRNVAAGVRRLGNHGRSAPYQHAAVGWNSRMGALEAVWLDLSLDHLAPRIASRRRAAERYRSRLADVRGVRVVAPPEGYGENGYLAVVLVPPTRRAAVLDAMDAAGVGNAVIYPEPVSRQAGAADFVHASVGGERAAELCASTVNPPLFAYIDDAEVDGACAAIESAVGAAQ